MAGKNSWKQWYDPNATEKDYERWRKQHNERIREEAVEMLNRAIGNTGRALPVAQIAAATGLSESTVYRLRKNGFGKRGPLLTTYLAMRQR